MIDPLAVQCDEHEAPRSIGVPCAPGGTCCAHRHQRAAVARIQQRAGKAPVQYRGKWRDLVLADEAAERTAAIDSGVSAPVVLSEEKN